MKTTKFLNFDCVSLESALFSLLVTQSVGPRIISLRFNGGDNLFAELPDFVTGRPGGEFFRFYGGHRLWHAPENMPRTYVPDDGPVEVVPTRTGLSVTQQVEIQTGIEKSIHVSLVEDEPQVIVHHTLTNRSSRANSCRIVRWRSGYIPTLPIRM